MFHCLRLEQRMATERGVGRSIVSEIQEGVSGKMTPFDAAPKGGWKNRPSTPLEIWVLQKDSLPVRPTLWPEVLLHLGWGLTASHVSSGTIEGR